MSRVLDKYQELHPESARLYQRAQNLFPDGVTHDTRYSPPFPLVVTHAKAGRKWDVDGHEYVDFVMGHGALLLGHAHDAVVAAVAEQVRQGTHYGASHELEMRWAELVVKLVPSAERVRFVSSGTEATMMALRLARAFTGRTHVIKFENHFHGWSDSLLAETTPALGIPQETWATMDVLPPGDIGLVEERLRQSENVAAIIVEPTGAHMGGTPLDPAFLAELRVITTRHDVVLIFDEVVTGFRTSPGGAQARYGVTPDLTTLAKILGGGLPGGAVAGSKEIMDVIAHRSDGDSALPRVGHPGTFNGNPVSAAAGVACLELVATGEPNRLADAAAEQIKQGIIDVLRQQEIPGCAYGVASLVDVHLGLACGTNGDSHPMDRGIPGHLNQAMLNEGVDLMGGSKFIVSAAHTQKDVTDTVSAFERGVRALQEDGLL